MLYNANLGYNSPQISYTGSLIIEASGINNSIILNNISLIYTVAPDYSNNTVVATASITYAPIGVISLESVFEDLSRSSIY